MHSISAFEYSNTHFSIEHWTLNTFDHNNNETLLPICYQQTVDDFMNCCCCSCCCCCDIRINVLHCIESVDWKWSILICCMLQISYAYHMSHCCPIFLPHSIVSTLGLKSSSSKCLLQQFCNKHNCIIFIHSLYLSIPPTQTKNLIPHTHHTSMHFKLSYHHFLKHNFPYVGNIAVPLVLSLLQYLIELKIQTSINYRPHHFNF